MAYFDKYGVEFSDDRKTLVRCPKDLQGKYEIPYGVSCIADEAFYGCSKLTSLIIGFDVKTIGNRAFYGCSDLVGLVITYSVTSIGDYAFCGCSLKSPLYVNHMFAYMPSTYSGAYTIPDNIKSIIGGAFCNCHDLTSITIPNSVASIGCGAFYGCSNLTSVTIPNSVKSIGAEAFSSCSSLISVTIGNSVTSIGEAAFEGCIMLGSVTTPSSVISIGDRCFYRCENMKTVTINASNNHGVKSIGKRLFNRCNELESINVIGGNPNLPLASRAKDNCLFCLYSVDGVLYCNVPYVRSTGFHNTLVAFPSKKNISSFSIPYFVDEIADVAFCCCFYLRTIRLGSYIKRLNGSIAFFSPKINDFAFCSSKLNEIIVSAGSLELLAKEKGLLHVKNKLKENEMEILSDGKIFIRYSPCFEGKMVIPDGVEVIQNGAFSGCRLSSITIPSAVKTIEDGAFKGCDTLTKIIVSDSNPNYCSCDGVLYNKDMTILICCPSARPLQHIPDSVTQITSDALFGVTVTESARERIHAIYLEMKRRREQYENEKRIQEEKTREEAKRIAEEKERQRINQEREAKELQLLQEQQMQEMLQDSILFFDTETTGKPQNYRAPVTDSDNWPRLVQLAWIMADKSGNVLKKKSVIIKPEGFSIPSDVAAVHGITTERANREGKPLREVLEEFATDLSLAEQVVGHNVDFDQHIVGAELYRLNMDYGALMDKPCICTMRSSTDFCAIPNSNSYYGGYKWPSLQELYRKLFNRSFEDAHDALADISATKDCYFELKRRGII